MSRCPLLRISPAQRGRLADIRDNLLARISEAEREGWYGEVEGLKVSLAAANNKLAQADATAARRSEDRYAPVCFECWDSRLPSGHSTR